MICLELWADRLQVTKHKTAIRSGFKDFMIQVKGPEIKIGIINDHPYQIYFLNKNFTLLQVGLSND